MLKHAVMFEMNHPEAGRDLRERLLALPARIAEIQHYEVGLHTDAEGSEDACKVLLLSHFSDRAALKAYQVHPAHCELLSWLRDEAAGRLKSAQAVDYQVEV